MRESDSNTTHQPSHNRGAVVTARILDATVNALAALGPTGLRMDAIAARAGVNKSTVYRRFASADALAHAALEAYAEAALPIPDEGGLVGDLRALFDTVAAALQTPLGHALLAALRPRPEEPEAIRVLRTRYWAGRERALRVVFERAVARGECSAMPVVADVLEQLVAPAHYRVHVRGAALGGELRARCVQNALAACSPVASVRGTSFTPSLVHVDATS